MNKRPLCIAPGCYSRGQHKDDCEGGECRGCVPRVAMSDAYLCEGCRRRMGDNIAALPTLYGELGIRLAHGSGNADKTPSKPGSRTPNPHIMQVRADIRNLLVTWARIVIEERGWQATPDDNIQAIASFMLLHVEWLGQQPFAADPAGQFAEVERKAQSAAHPNGTRTFVVASCPMDCEGEIRAVLRRTDSLLPSELLCDVDDQHRWNSTQWVKLGRTLLKAAA